jgi:hypothetical protein
MEKKGGLRCLGELASPSVGWLYSHCLAKLWSRPFLMRILSVHINWFIHLILADHSPLIRRVIGRNERPVAQ